MQISHVDHKINNFNKISRFKPIQTNILLILNDLKKKIYFEIIMIRIYDPYQLILYTRHAVKFF